MTRDELEGARKAYDAPSRPGRTPGMRPYEPSPGKSRTKGMIDRCSFHGAAGRGQARRGVAWQGKAWFGKARDPHRITEQRKRDVQEN
jgi:hypothetical protein